MGVQPITVPPTLAYVLTSAGDRNGVDFDYLLQTAIRESSLNPKAKAQSSSATGLFQFIESTWLEVMKSDGPRLGYQAYADAITQDGDGDYVINDKELREEVLKLREDPQIAADLAAAFTRNNGAYLHERFGRMPSPGELYIAHFMGARGAEALFRAGLEDPDQIAANLFPKQARANPTIFYELGEPRTIREVYKALVAKHIGAVVTDARFAVQQMTGEPPELRDPADPSEPPIPATRSKWPDAQAIPSRFGPTDMSFTTLFATEAEVKPRTLLTPTDADPEAPLFATFYGPPSP
jgi:hypothetical protein